MDVKNPVKKSITINIDKRPVTNDKRFSLDFDLRLTLTKIGKIGRMHGDNIEITPVAKEIKGRISI